MTSEPYPSASPALESEQDREARLEELLLSGLDHYFAGQHELAINVWTRALFIDRGHARARAYIERARSAIAERQREGEELIHSGAAAFQQGDPDTARRLLRSAVEHGVASEEALALLAQPKERRGRGQAKPPLKDLGPDPGTGKPIVVKEGRFGPYVTDGETNASLRRGDDPEGLTMDRALELLAERRAKGPAPKKTKRVAGKR